MPKNRMLIGTLSLENRHFTRVFLYSVFRGDWGYADYLVIDNGSKKDDILSLKPEFPEVNFLRNETNQGVAKGWNQLLKYGEHDYYCITNNDVFFPKRFVQLMTEFMDAHPEVGCASPYTQDCRQDLAEKVSARYDQIRGFYTNEKQLFAAMKYTYLPWHINPTEMFTGFDNYCWFVEDQYKGQVLPQILGSCFILRKETIKDIGYLEEAYTENNQVGISEDFELSWRLNNFENGKWKQMMNKACALHHYSCQTRKNDAIMQAHYGIDGDTWENKRHENTKLFTKGDELRPQ